MSGIAKITGLIQTMKAKTKSLQTMIGGTDNSDVSDLDTTATHLVGAINEVRGVALANVGVSSTEIDNRIATARAAVKAEILGGAGPTVDTLIELATLMSSNQSSDAALAVIVGNKANSSDVYTKAEMGDPETDLVAIWNAA